VIFFFSRSIIISRKRKLQELYAVCRHVERSKVFPNGDIVATWGTVEDYGGANMEDAEKRFLEENDMDRSVTFV
jgi:chromatin modification-related protein VID21